MCRNLCHPDDVQEESEEEYTAASQQYGRYQEYSEQEYSPAQRSSPRQEVIQSSDLTLQSQV